MRLMTTLRTSRVTPPTVVLAVLLSAPTAAWAQARPQQPSAPRPATTGAQDPNVAPAADAPVEDQPPPDKTPLQEGGEADGREYTGYAPQSGGRPQEPGAPDRDKLEVNIGGGLILLYAQSLQQGKTRQNNFEIFEARLRMDARYGRYLVHITPRFRNTKERDFFPGISWVEEAYIGAEFGTTILKVGKIYRQFGRFWDNSFMGNVQEYDGLKLDMNHGVSFEGKLAEKERMGLGFAAQYFVVDGTTNYALPLRDTQTYAGSRRRNQLVGRVEPFYNINDTMTAKLGLSAEYFQADLATIGVQDVGRLSVDATYMLGTLAVWAEYTHQFGRHVTDFPIPPDDDDETGQSSNQINYFLLGGDYTYGMFAVRYNFSLGDYRGLDLKETRHVPGIQVNLNEYMMVLLEYSHVTHHAPGGNTVLDSGLFLTLHAKF